MPPSHIIHLGPIRLGVALFQLPTFEALARQHIAENSGSWRSAKHRAQWLSSLATYAFPTLGSMRVNEITLMHVIETLSPIWTTKPKTARRVRQRIRSVMDRAVAMEYVDYNPAGDAINAALARQRRAGPTTLPCPALQGPARSPPDGSGVHRRHAGEAGLPDAGGDWPAAPGRSRERPGMRSTTTKRPGTIPRSRMKAGKRHRVPLSHRALAVLYEVRGLSDGSGLVFPAPRSGGIISDMAFTQLLRRLGLDFVPHGLRSSFRDWAAEQTGSPHAVVETALAHTVGNATEADYFRSDLFELRRDLMDEWSAYLEGGINR